MMKFKLIAVLPLIMLAGIGGFVAAIFTPEVISRTRATAEAAAEEWSSDQSAEEQRFTVQEAFDKFTAEEELMFENMRLERERDQAIIELGNMLAVNEILEEQLRTSEANLDATKELAEGLISFGLATPKLTLYPTPHERETTPNALPETEGPTPQAITTTSSSRRHRWERFR